MQRSFLLVIYKLKLQKRNCVLKKGLFDKYGFKQRMNNVYKTQIF